MSRLQAGEKAPLFKLQNQDDDLKSLNDYEGKWLILYFYPKDNTPGCTVEAKDFTCLLSSFSELETQVVGVSKDSTKSHRNFISKQELTINLLSDPEMHLMDAYGAWGEKNMYGKKSMGVIRSTFLIDPKGKIAHAWYNVRAKGHAERVLSRLKELV
ncbi:MAG: thioredoxin-dependent thiol peroxidase [Candidatus Zophobacter franzmannii]|nr:thioredoxin-dependent thiol peroxidase [Candidatus Zophobacter franzmannii]